ncbi:hypothetical protein FMN63_09610 [Stappia sp. BW2]|uniref:hypothetical protein n=1 Tax=Stappia sp. BW2 TaxID=2592622 RepID=UPI0011DED4E8|nr:hypothetical protein [Stappia sp. BW2]TYC70148.1 hypothetical protein FMN63_09610 [Stappia sp. BW2]
MTGTAAKIAKLALALMMSAPAVAAAQQVELEGSVKLTPFEAEGVTLSTTYTVDAAFAAKHDIEVPVPFSLAAPRREAQQILAQAKPAGGGPIKIYFTTDDETKRIYSSLHIVTYTLKTDDPQKRLEVGDYVAIELLKKLGTTDDTRLNVRRQITLGDLPASEIVGNFVNKDGDRLLVRLVALAKPGSERGIVGIAVGHPRQGRIKKVEDIYQTSASLAFDTVTFK